MTTEVLAAEGAFDRVGAMPGHLLRRCQQIAVSLFLKECRRHALTPLQFAVLAALDQSGPLDQVGLGGLVALDRTTVSVVVRKLEARGCVSRRVSQSDRRSKLIEITDAGRALLDAAWASVEQVQDRLLDPLSMEERDCLQAMLRKIADENNEHSRAPARA